MSRQSMFESLSRTIPEKERKQLLEKISRSLSLKVTADDNIHHVEMPEDERKALISGEIASMTFSRKVALWFECVTNTTSRENGLILMKLNAIRRKIRRLAPGLVNFDTRTFSPKLASLFFALFERIVPLVPIFRDFWSDDVFFEGMILHVLGKKLRTPGKSTTDLIPLDELKKLYLRTEKKDDVRNEIIRMMNEYVQTIPDGIFKDAEEDLLPLYYFRDLVFFPFHEIFFAFGFIPGENLPEDQPEFKEATIGLIQEAIEKLFYTLYVAQKVPPSFSLSQDLFEYRKKNDVSKAENAGVRAKELRDGMNACRREVTHFLQKVPLPDIIRYFRQDPYYRMMFYLPNPRLKEFYHSALKVQLFSEFEMVFKTIRHAVMEDLIKEIFGEQKLEKLSFYTDYPDFHWKRLGIPFFSHVFIMSVVFSYVSKLFKRKSHVILDMIARRISTGRRELQDLLVFRITAIEDLIEKIHTFDYSLSSETDDGKTFARARFSLESDRSHLRIYETLINQKDREAKVLIDNCFENLDSLIQSFSEALAVLRRTPRRKGGQDDDQARVLLEKKITEQISELTRFRKLLMEIRGLEIPLKIR